MSTGQSVPPPLLPADRLFTLMPFWFWNDELEEAEILRQIADFEAHGVHGFVLHPRIGLPEQLGWMSPELLGFMELAIAEAERRNMKVLLYDEGMYPSGSSCGQVVARHADYACRCLAMQMLDGDAEPVLGADQRLVGEQHTRNGRRVALIDRKADSVIRGLHYLDETRIGEAAEQEPPMGDILNPAAVQCFIELVYDGYHRALQRYFGGTVIGIFTDEPNPLGRCREPDVRPFTTGILPHVSETLGYDITPHLPALWLDDEPDAQRHRRNYDYAIRRRMEQTWYRPLSDWCKAHGVALCGHPADGDEIGAQRYFQIPGQDLVWRDVEPDKSSAIEGPQSTQAKATSSAMIHLGRRRNSNEFCGAYGRQTTFDEFMWLANWCMVRGVNLLIPHAFYYSVRGPRRDERPPQTGPHSRWWDRFAPFSEACRRICQLNTDSRHVCELAILTDAIHCPWRSAKICLENQWDFNYLESELIANCRIGNDGVHIAGMCYHALIIEDEAMFSPMVRQRLAAMDSGRLIVGTDDLCERIGRWCRKDVRATDCPALRYRHVVKDGCDVYLLFNESCTPIDMPMSVSVAGEWVWIDPASGQADPSRGEGHIALAGHEMAMLMMRRQDNRGMQTTQHDRV